MASSLCSLLNSCVSPQWLAYQRSTLNKVNKSFNERAMEAAPGLRPTRNGPNSAINVGENDPLPLPRLGENGLYAESHCSRQTTAIEYTEDSTEDDPIVRIRGISLSGEYDYTMHINDIDARNATYPELCALVHHQVKTGEYRQTGVKYAQALPSEMDHGDYSKRQDFTQALRGCIGKNQRYNPDVAAQARELLSLYERFVAEHADKIAENVTRAAEQMAAVDRARLYLY